MNCLISSSCDPSNEKLDVCYHKPSLCTGDGGFAILAERAHVSDRYVRRILSLASLAPDIVDAILDGRQPEGLTVDRLEDGFPLDWAEQRRNLGFPAA